MSARTRGRRALAGQPVAGLPAEVAEQDVGLEPLLERLALEQRVLQRIAQGADGVREDVVEHVGRRLGPETQGRWPRASGAAQGCDEVGELAQQRAGVAGVDELLDQERLGGPERRTHRGRAAPSSRRAAAARSSGGGRVELGSVGGLDPPSSGSDPQSPDGHAYR